MEPPERPLTMEDDLLPELPQKRPFDALYLHHDGIYHPEDRHDGRPDLGYGPRSKQFHYAYLASDQRVNDVDPEDKKAEESDSSVGSASDDNSKPRTNRGMTRQQQRTALAPDYRPPRGHGAEVPPGHREGVAVLVGVAID